MVSHRSPWNQMEGSDYEGKCSQWADDMGRESNYVKRNDKSVKGKEQGKS